MDNDYEEDGAKTSGRRGKWTEEEDELLREGVEELGKQWTAIARRINDRSGQDCLHRWEFSLRPDLIKGPWSAEVSASHNVAMVIFA